MKIAIASGKGGTGKTTVAVNLALAASARGTSVRLLDCDVEEPNCHLFLESQPGPEEGVYLPTPALDESRCTGCGDCARICRFRAIACLAGTVVTFPELCHGCGGCILACPEHCLTEEGRLLGWVQNGSANGLAFGTGRLRIGEAMASPLIRSVKRLASPDGLTIIDAPPGTACPVISTVEGCDLVVLVTEPTPFGLNDMALAVEMLRTLNIPFGVVINRSDSGDNRVEDYCLREKISVLGRIPHDTGLAMAYSRGEAAINLPGYRNLFGGLLDSILEAAGGNGGGG